LYKLLFFWGKWLNPHVNQTQNYHNYKPTFNQYCIQSYVLYLQYIGQIFERIVCLLNILAT